MKGNLKAVMKIEGINKKKKGNWKLRKMQRGRLEMKKGWTGKMKEVEKVEEIVKKVRGALERDRKEEILRKIRERI